jgi:hypothetical protein
MVKNTTPSINRQRLNNMMKNLLKSIRLFASQGHPNVCYNAQFFRGGKKQNPISKGDIESFSENVRSFITSEEADTVRIEFIDEDSGKTFYTKVMDNLMLDTQDEGDVRLVAALPSAGLSGYNGLGEAQVTQVNDLITRKVSEERRNDEFMRLGKEVDELRSRNVLLEAERDELEASLKAKKDLEFYSGIIGAAFPGLATLMNGTSLAQAAGFLSGTTDMNGNAVTQKEAVNEDVNSISALVSEFCTTLNTQEASAVHLLFMAFEADRSKIQSALHYITTAAPPQPR